MRQKNFLTALLVAALVTPSSFAQTGTVPVPAKKAKATKSSRLTTKASLKTQRGPQARGGSSSDTILPAGSLAPATGLVSPYGLPIGQVVPAAGSPTTTGLLPSGSRVASILPVTAQCAPGTPGCSAALPAVQPQQSSNMAPMMAALAALAGVFGGNKNKNDSNKSGSNNTNSNGGGGGGSPNYQDNGDGNSSPAPENAGSTSSLGQTAKEDTRNHELASAEKSDEKKPIAEMASSEENNKAANQPLTESSTCEKKNPNDAVLDWQKVSGQQTRMEPVKPHCNATAVTFTAFGRSFSITRPHPTTEKHYIIQSTGDASPIFSPAEGDITDVKEVDVIGDGKKDACDTRARTPVDNPGAPREVQCIVTIKHEHCPNNDKISCVSEFRFNALSGRTRGEKNSCLQLKKLKEEHPHVTACQVIARIGKQREKDKLFYSLTGSDNSDQTPQLKDRSAIAVTERPVYEFKPGDFNQAGGAK